VRKTGGILKLIKTGNLNQASQALQNAYGVAFKQESLQLKAIPDGELIETLLKEHNYTTAHLEMLAELFYAEAGLALAEKRYADGLQFYQKSLTLYEFIDREYRSYSQERQDRMKEIRDRMADIEGRL
jgi:hypothetical protein